MADLAEIQAGYVELLTELALLHLHEDAAQSLLPAGFELLPAIFGGRAVYAACRRSGTDGELPHPHHGQWSTTLPLAICGACLRAYAALDQDRDSAGRR